MNKKISLKIFFCIFFLIAFVHAQEIIDFGKSLGLGEGIINGSGITEKDGIFTFEEKNAQLNVKESEFKNIQSQSESKNPTYIKIDKKTGSIIGADFTTNGTGGTYSLGGTKFIIPPNSRVIFKDGEIKLPSDSSITQFKGEGKIKGDKIKLPNKNVISGVLNFKEEQAYLVKGDKAIINGIEIKKAEENTNFYFDGKEHQGRYISFGEKNLIIESDNTFLPVNFLEDNKYIKIDKGDYVAMRVIGNSKMEIQNRDNLEKIPLVITKGGFAIDEDNKCIYYKSEKDIRILKNSGLKLIDNPEESTTSPIELVMLDMNGEKEEMEGHKMFIDNFNRIAISPKKDEETLSKSEGMDIKFSSKIKYNYPTENNIESLTGKKIGKDINFYDLDKGNKDMILGKLRDYYPSLTSEMKSSLTKFNFVSDDYFMKKLKGKENSAAFTTEDDQIITFRGNLKFEYTTFIHESTHAYQFDIAKDKDGLLSEYQKKINLYKEKEREYNNKLIKGYEDLRLKEELNKLKADNEKSIIEYKNKKSLYEEEWESISGDSYGKIKLEKKNNHYSYVYSDDPSNMGAKYGCVEPYGCKDLWEDGATFVEKIIIEPEFFKDKINPKSNTYDIRFRKKIDLLVKYNFISEEKYKQVLNLAGVQ